MQNTSDFADLFAKELHAIGKKFSNSADQSAPEKTKVNSSLETENFLLNSDNKSCEKLSRDQFREACSSSEKVNLQGDFSTKVVVPSGNGDEPFVGYTPVNLVALCFSGGGIRSSTFNLGVLQGLNEIGLIPEFDYLSTVSGGGYVGSWWTAWRHRNKSLGRSERIPVTGTNQPEPEEISWLRQRGNFLSPSTGTHKTEHHGRERIIPIGPKGRDILRPYLLREKETHCFSPVDSEKKRREELHASRSTPLSCGNRPGTNRTRKPKRSAGVHYTADSYRRAIHRACDVAFSPPEPLSRREHETLQQWLDRLTDKQRAELEKWQSDHRWSPNRLRHSAATEIRKRFGLEGAQVILGHASADVTQVYAERDLQKAVEIMREVG